MSESAQPEYGEIQIARHLGRGIVVEAAPGHAKAHIGILAATQVSVELQANRIRIADQVAYEITGYDPGDQTFTLRLDRDWRPGQKDSPEEPAATCTATITGVGIDPDRVYRCGKPAGHYDRTDIPDPLAEPPTTGAWHAAHTTDGDSVWADEASGATPHVSTTEKRLIHVVTEQDIEDHAPVLINWAAANGLDPARVDRSGLTIEQHGDRTVIAYTEVQLDTNGRKILGPGVGPAFRLHRTATLRQALPEGIGRPLCTCTLQQVDPACTHHP